jgi:DNA-directed RNA polymerase subunit M/transcription elongation factor TFIIS
MKKRYGMNTRCKQCGSGFTYYKRKTKERICRYCGYVEQNSFPTPIIYSDGEKNAEEKIVVEKSTTKNNKEKKKGVKLD